MISPVALLAFSSLQEIRIADIHTDIHRYVHMQTDYHMLSARAQRYNHACIAYLVAIMVANCGNVFPFSMALLFISLTTQTD